MFLIIKILRQNSLNLLELKRQIKKIALGSGAKLVGVGNRERLEKAPLSANMDYCLKGAQSCIIWAYPNSYEALKNYFSKKDRMGFKKQQHFAYSTGWKTALEIAEFINTNSEYEAFPVIPNGKYRETGSFSRIYSHNKAVPDFSLRYGAVAAGLGHIGWSGNLVTEKYGGSLFLAGVLTMAPLEPDPMATENHCNRCKICVNACTTGFFSINELEDPVFIGGHKQEYSKRNSFLRCAIGCAGWTGLSEDGSWTSWTPGHVCLKRIPESNFKDKNFVTEFNKQLFTSKETPKKILKFNRIILNSFARVAINENVGLRSLEDTNPRCGFCSAICVADPKKRAELYRLLKNSGKLFIEEEGREYVKKVDESGKEIIYYPSIKS